MRSLNNFRAEQPHQHAMYYLRLLMTEVAWTKDELKEALDGELNACAHTHMVAEVCWNEDAAR